MRNLLLLLLTICLNTAVAQSPTFDDKYNFKIEDKEVVWQYIYDTEFSTSEVIKYFSDSGFINVLSSDSTSLMGRVDYKALDYLNYGLPSMSHVPYIRGSDFSYIINVHAKDKKYQVTISSVLIRAKVDLALAGLGADGNTIFNLETYAYNHKKNKLRPRFNLSKANKLLATVWHTTYLIKNKQEISKDWYPRHKSKTCKKPAK